MFDDEVESIHVFDPLTGHVLQRVGRFTVYPSSHYVTPRSTTLRAIEAIKQELRERIEWFQKHNKLVECQRIEQRTRFDLEMLNEMGFCKGIENYSRHLSGRQPGEPPPTLLDYLPHDALMIIDESHVTIPQVGGMYRGDRARKENLVDYGFRLPSALDNRPLRFDEFERHDAAQRFSFRRRRRNTSARTRGRWSSRWCGPPVSSIPRIEVRPASTQVDDLLSEINDRVKVNERVLVTTLTKRMAEDLTDYLAEHGIKVRYLHSDIETVERVEIIRDLRLGEFDVLVGINLLREGLDMPEVSLVAILDADKEGFPALGALAHPDDRARGAAYQRHGDPVCADRDDRFDAARDRRDRPAARQAGRRTTKRTASRRRACTSASRTSSTASTTTRARARSSRPRRTRRATSTWARRT